MKSTCIQFTSETFRNVMKGTRIRSKYELLRKVKKYTCIQSKPETLKPHISNLKSGTLRKVMKTTYIKCKSEMFRKKCNESHLHRVQFLKQCTASPVIKFYFIVYIRPTIPTEEFWAVELMHQELNS